MMKQKETQDDFSDVRVTLKPIFGIKPRIYISVIYGILVLLLLFGFLLFPGISNNGTFIKFSSYPEKAPVYVDNRYIGSTPVEAYVKSGNRVITIEKPFYKTIQQNKVVNGPVFASLFFPSRTSIHSYLEIEDAVGLLKSGLKDYASIGMIRDFTFDYQFPPILSNAALFLHAKNSNTEQISENMSGFIDNAMYFVDSEYELHDLIKTVSILGTKGGFLSISGLINIVKKSIQVKEAYKDSPIWVLNSLPKSPTRLNIKLNTKYGLYEKMKTSKWFNSFMESLFKEYNSMPLIQPGNPYRESIYVNGKNLSAIPSGSYLFGDTPGIKEKDDLLREQLPRKIDIRKFYIAESEITNLEFFQFVKENPTWLPSNKKDLLEKNLVSANYLETWKDDKPSENASLLPVTHVSYYAAIAYCDWASKRIPAGFSGFKVRLPYETEWEYIAKIDEQAKPLPYNDKRGTGPVSAAGAEPDRFGLRNMYGNLWCWCSDWFFPVVNLLDPLKNSDLKTPGLIGSEKSVRGGSWANSKEDNLKSFSRGSFAPHMCTAFTGFRIVLSDH